MAGRVRIRRSNDLIACGFHWVKGKPHLIYRKGMISPVDNRSRWSNKDGMLNKAITHEQLTSIRSECVRLGVRELAFFGSVLREDYGPRSDVDALVEFGSHSTLTPFEQYFELKERMEALLGRTVDLVTRPSMRNPFFRQAVEQGRMIIHAGTQAEAVV